MSAQDPTDFAEKFVELTGRETITESRTHGDDDRLADEFAGTTRETAVHAALDDAIDDADFDDY